MRAPAGSYLIVARPRSRTGWLSSILFSDDLPCFHDEFHLLWKLVDRGTPFGLAAPSLPGMPPHYVDLFQDSPIVVVDRDLDESFASLARFSAEYIRPPDAGAKQMYESRYKALIEQLPSSNMLKVAYSALDDFAVVDRIFRHCTGRPLGPDRFYAFNLLRVEQHLPKVICNTPLSVIGAQQWHG